MSERVAKRKAGRPPLAPSDDAQVTMRRERDRLAQRHSRQRKANALAEKDERIDRLSRTIEDLTSVFTDFNEIVFKSRVVQLDLQAAKDLKHLADRFLTAAQDASREEDDGNEPTLQLSLPSSTSPISHADSTPVFAPVQISHSNAILYAPRPRSANSDGTYTLSHPIPERSWSPRLAYGLVTNHAVEYPSSSRVTTLPTCLRVPKDTFGWRLLQESFLAAYPLFTTMDHKAPYPKRTVDIFQHTMRHESVAETINFLCIIIEYYFTLWGKPLSERTKKMSTQSPEFKAMENSALAMRQSKQMLSMLIKRDVYLRGEDINDYMHAWAVERYLENSWGLDLTSTTVSLKRTFWNAAPGDHTVPTPPPPSFGADPSAFMDLDPTQMTDVNDYISFDKEFGSAVPDADPTGQLHGRASDVFYATGTKSVKVDNLICKIKNLGVCFGNGPRFHRQRVDEVVSRFLSMEGLVSQMPTGQTYTSDHSMDAGVASVVAPV